MNDQHPTELSEDQKRLVSAFNLAAEYFKQKLLDSELLQSDESLVELVDRFGAQQASSKIAEESYAQLTPTTNERQGFLQAIKAGAARDEDGNFFAQAILDQEDELLKEKLAHDCKVRILASLLVYAKSEALLPDDYIKNEMLELGQPRLDI